MYVYNVRAEELPLLRVVALDLLSAYNKAVEHGCALGVGAPQIISITRGESIDLIHKDCI